MDRYIFSHQEQQAFEHLRQPFAIYQYVNKRVVTLVLSDGFCRLFGYEDREEAYYVMDNDMYKDTHPDDVARIADAAIRFATEGGKYEVIYRTRKKGSAGYVVIHAMGEHVYTEDGVRLAHVWYTDEGSYVEDSAGQKFELTRTLSNALHEQSIIKASKYDYLTGLPSMTYFFELAETGKESILNAKDKPLLLYIDFVGIKFFNTKYGFTEGDKLLQAFARLLAYTFSSENCCRIGADHFAVIAEENGLEEKLGRIFREFGELNGGKTPPLHVGIYPYRIENIPISTACDRAKFACKALKGSYSSCFNYYSSRLREHAVLKQYIIENFNRAIAEKWIRVYLQPIIRAVNGRVCDVEALAGWNDPEKGLLPPDSFIPALEDAGLIYRLDLYMVERILELIKIQIADGTTVIPYSINLSRSDFDSCDMVEEIRKRVDEAGVRRDRITIEITESVIGSDFEFMKKQVERFRELGFPVWMDDFGSGYSSLDLLQSIQFDLIKFDRSFIWRINEGKNGRIILAELMRMATSLGVDTVCEGVETEEQVRFLLEIGCSKLQGYHYSKPIPFAVLRELYKSKNLLEYENPDESEYYESIGQVNLYDLGVIASDEENILQHSFSTVPIAILEVYGDTARYVRSNRTFQYFAKRFFNIDILEEDIDFRSPEITYWTSFVSAVKQCCKGGSPVFFDEKVKDGSVFHFYARRIQVNPVTGNKAVGIAVISITEPGATKEYADVAKSLAEDYSKFFSDVLADGTKTIDPENMERYLRVLTKEKIHHLVMEMVRVRRENETTKEAFEQAQNSFLMYSHLARALARGYTDLFYVNMDTNELIEFYTDDRHGVLSENRRSADFFEGCARDAKLYIHPDDQEKFVKAMNREFLTKALNTSGVFEMTYRRIKEGRTFYVRMKVTWADDDKRFIVVAVSDIDELMRNRIEEERIQEEYLIYSRLHAITGKYFCIYVVDPDKGGYREFSAAAEYRKYFNLEKEGTDFLGTLLKTFGAYIYPDDRDRILSLLSKENVLAEIERSGIFTLVYRMMKGNEPIYVQLEAAMIEEKGVNRLIIGLKDIDVLIRKEETVRKRLAKAQSQANIDALTGLKNKHAFFEAETRIDNQIEAHREPQFAVVILDVNDLKKVNDTAGHQMGDQYLREACKVICDIFKHSPVFRVGGDEFAVIVQGQDYMSIDQLLEQLAKHNKEAMKSGGVVIACGMAKYEHDGCVAAVFNRADLNMYENKNAMKTVF